MESGHSVLLHNSRPPRRSLGSSPASADSSSRSVIWEIGGGIELTAEVAIRITGPTYRLSTVGECVGEFKRGSSRCYNRSCRVHNNTRSGSWDRPSVDTR